MELFSARLKQTATEYWIGTLALGVLASGGPWSWNSILAYVTKAKDVKAAEAETRQTEARAKRATLPKHGH